MGTDIKFLFWYLETILRYIQQACQQRATEQENINAFNEAFESTKEGVWNAFYRTRYLETVQFQFYIENSDIRFVISWKAVYKKEEDEPRVAEQIKWPEKITVLNIERSDKNKGLWECTWRFL